MELHNSAASRQRADLLWDSTTALASGGTFSGDTRLVSGYGGISFLISSNLSFRLRIEEAPTSSGPWTETQRVTSALNAAATRQLVSQRIVPVGSYMRIFVDNLGGALQTSNTIHALGIPNGDAGGGGAGGGGGGAAAVANRPSFATGQNDVAVAGTAEQVSADQEIPNGFSVVIKAKNTNTGRIRVGNSQVNAQNAAVAFTLGSNDKIVYYITNLNLVWIDATVSGEGVEWTVET